MFDLSPHFVTFVLTELIKFYIKVDAVDAADENKCCKNIFMHHITLKFVFEIQNPNEEQPWLEEKKKEEKTRI